MIELTDQQCDNLQQTHEYPARVLNPRTGESLLLVSEELFERVRAILEEEDDIASVREMHPLVSQVLDQEEKSARESA